MSYTRDAIIARRGQVSDIHITRDVLNAVANGKMSSQVLTRAGWKHLMALCPFCRAEFEAWKRSRDASTAYNTVFRALPRLLEVEARSIPAKERRAERELRALLELPREKRLAKVRRSNTRFRSTALARLLLEEARRHVPADLQAACDLSEAALAVLNRAPAGPDVPDLHAKAAAALGNALRGLGDLPGAESRFALARHIITYSGVTDTLVYAEVDWLEGILRKDQRRFAEAEELLGRAVAFYRLAGEQQAAIYPLVALGLLSFDRQDYQEAEEIFRVVLRTLDPAAEPRLYCYAYHNLALALCEQGAYAAAAELVEAGRTLYQGFPDRYTQSRLAWIEGKIAAGLGHLEEAERAFLAIRTHFLAEEIGYDAAMVSLDLALVYLRQGKAAELRQLVEELQPIFAAEDLHQEAGAAFLLFQEAVREERVTVKLIKDLLAFLKRARTNPELRSGV
jgi:tetratricopeptide (TPR) repeat protein